MYLYHLTLQPATCIQTSVIGTFTRAKEQEMVVIRGGTMLELLRLNPETGKLISLGATPTFSNVRSLATVRPMGEETDHLVVSSDSGMLIVLQWGGRQWRRVVGESYGRTGIRRTIAGEYVAADPHGRALMLAALERQKFVWLCSKESEDAQLKVSSPLEAHRSNVVLIHLVACDPHYDSPLFAALEIDCNPVHDDDVTDESKLERTVVFYEVDISVNTIVKKGSELVKMDSNMLFAVPSGEIGPGGILVCSGGLVTWLRLGYASHSVPLPQRDDPIINCQSRPVIITTGCAVRIKSSFFYLLQTEVGDLLRLTIQHDKDKVSGMTCQYFDTIPVAISLGIFQSGFLFAAGEWGNHRLYQILSLGEDASPSISSGIEAAAPHFKPHQLLHLALIDQLENFAEMTDSRLIAGGDGGEVPQLIAAQGRGAQSSLNLIKHGMRMTDVAESDLPAQPTGIWTLKNKQTDPEHAFMIVSFNQNTVVLSVGETVEELNDTGFLNELPTISCGQLSDNSFVQIHPAGFRQIFSDGKSHDWDVTSGVRVVVAAINTRQVLLALDNLSLVYFEQGETSSGQLVEKRVLADLPENVTSLALAPVPEGRLRAKFAAVGSTDLTVRILSCDPDDCLEPISLQAFAAIPNALLINDLAKAFGADAVDDETVLLGSLVLDVGLQNGVYARLRLDGTSGALTDARTRFLGTLPVRLGQCLVEGGREALLAMSSSPWSSYQHHGQGHLTPLISGPLLASAPFSSPQCPFGMVAITEGSLRISMIENLNEIFTRTRLALDQTPRKLTLDQNSGLLAAACSDLRALTSEERAATLSSWQILTETEGDPDGKAETADWHLASLKGKPSSSISLIDTRTMESLPPILLDEYQSITW